MEVFDSINWNSDDGVSLSMINDVPRNAFYDKILQESVNGKSCCDVGFGTGFLSILAIKHGAEHVIAFEKDPVRYQLVKNVIKKCGLEDRIELHNTQATINILDTLDCEIIYHEIIHQDIWGEGLHLIAPRHSNKTYLPGKYFFELWAMPVTDIAIDGFTQGSELRFNPGIDMNPVFVNTINEIVGNNHIIETHYDAKLQRLNWDRIHQDWSWDTVKVFDGNDKELIYSYCFDFNTQINIPEGITHTIKLPKGKNLLLQPRFGLATDTHSLYLDSCRSWGTNAAWLYTNIEHDVIFKQQFTKLPGYSLEIDN